MKILLILLLIAPALVTHAQDSTVDIRVVKPKDKDIVSAGPDYGFKVYQVVEQMPEYPGSEDALLKFIQKNIQYPDMERENDIQGRVVIGFVVNEDGSLSDISVRKGVSAGIDAEAMRVVRLMPKFRPGKQQGQAVKVAYVLPITFKLAPDSIPAGKVYDPRKRGY